MRVSMFSSGEGFWGDYDMIVGRHERLESLQTALNLELCTEYQDEPDQWKIRSRPFSLHEFAIFV
jgi:hypothetical protein